MLLAKERNGHEPCSLALAPLAASYTTQGWEMVVIQAARFSSRFLDILLEWVARMI